jgi:hypothetical protein
MGFRALLLVISLPVWLWFFQFFPVALFTVWGLEFDWTNTQMQQAVIAGSVVAAGWFATFIFRECSTIFDRSEMGRDVLAALTAEIQDFDETLSLSQDEADRYSADLDTNVMAPAVGALPYFPFFSSIAPVLVANRFSGELRSLPHPCVTPVVQFYATYADLQVMLEDMRNTSFKELSPDRRLLLYQDFIATRLQLGECAEAAIKAMNGAAQSGLMGVLTRLETFSFGRALGIRKHH